MDVQQLRYVLALSQELHFKRAADKVHVTQPTLSHGIKKLEKEIGIDLFERSSQMVRLTSAGETFLPYAVGILDQLQNGVDAVREESKEITGRIKIGAIPTICPYLMPASLIAMRREAKKLTIELHEEKTSDILEHLRTGELDLGVLALPIKDRGIASRTVGKEPFFLAVSKKHPLARKKKATLNDVVKERLLILQEGHCFGDQSIEYCKLQRNDSQVSFQGSSFASVMSLAASGDGVTFVPQMVKNTMPTAGIIYIPLVNPAPLREIGIVWRLSTPLSKAQRYCLEVIEKSFRSINKLPKTSLRAAIPRPKP